MIVSVPQTIAMILGVFWLHSPLPFADFVIHCLHPFASLANQLVRLSSDPKTELLTNEH